MRGNPADNKKMGDDLHQKGNVTMANKVTKKENFTAIIEVLKTAGRSDLVSVMEHEIELLDKKNSYKSNTPTTNQVENAEIAESLPTVLEAGKWYRLSEIKALVPALENASGTQRIAVICRKLEAEGVLTKMVEKRVIYYSLAD